MQTNPAAINSMDSSEYYLNSIRNDMYGDSDVNSGSDENNYVGDEENAEGSKMDIVKMDCKNGDRSGGKKSGKDGGDSEVCNGNAVDGNDSRELRRRVEYRLGTATSNSKIRNFLTFSEARDIARSWNLKTWKGWRKWSKSIRRPKSIPSDPERVYKQEWQGIRDWLGTYHIASVDRDFATFIEARGIVRTMKFKSEKEYEAWSKSCTCPNNIPTLPPKIYIKEWQGWQDWLGIGKVGPTEPIYLCFTEAREIVRALNLRGQKSWIVWSNSKHRPKNIPSNPNKVYQEEWQGLDDWLGTGRFSSRVFACFTEAREFVRSLHFKGVREYEAWSRSSNLPPTLLSLSSIQRSMERMGRFFAH